MAIAGIKRVEIHLLNRVDHKPREVILRQPIPHVRRHQERLLAITRNKALSHPRIVLNPSDDTPTYATASMPRRSPKFSPAYRVRWGISFSG
jgi:hypothetical protein